MIKDWLRIATRHDSSAHTFCLRSASHQSLSPEQANELGPENPTRSMSSAQLSFLIKLLSNRYGDQRILITFQPWATSDRIRCTATSYVKDAAMTFCFPESLKHGVMRPCSSSALAFKNQPVTNFPGSELTVIVSFGLKWMTDRIDSPAFRRSKAVLICSWFIWWVM